MIDVRQLADLLRTDFSAAKRELDRNRELLFIRSGLGETVLHYLVVEDELALVRFLCECGALVDTENDFGDTPLFDAFRLGYLEMCRFLVSAGADFRHVSPISGDHIFGRISAGDDPEVVAYFLSLLGPEEDLNLLFVDDMDVETLIYSGGEVSRLLVGRGLKQRWSKEDRDRVFGNVAG